MLNLYEILNKLIVAYKVSNHDENKMPIELQLVCKSISLYSRKIVQASIHRDGINELTTIKIMSKMNN